MRHKTFSPNDWNILLTGALAWVIFTLAAIVLALLGIFWKPLIAALLVAIIFGFSAVIYRKGWHRTISWELFAIIFISLGVAYFWTHFSEPTIFSGRDQGSISEAAIRLTQNHTLPFSTIEGQEFFKIYGFGKALNFPGFFYDSNGSLVTQFPVGYTSWLGAWFSLFGQFGFLIANTILLSLSLIFSYAVIRLFVTPFWAWLFFVFCTTSFIFVWFSRLTLSENMAAPLLWISIFSLLIFTKHQSRGTYITWASSALALALTRIEGFMIALVGLGIIFAHRGTRHYIRKNFKNVFLFSALIALVILLANTYRDWAFYREIIKVFKGIILPLIQQSSAEKTSSLLENFHAWKVLWAYFLVGYIALGLATIATAFVRGHFRLLLPFFVAVPTFIYLTDAHISTDHPWMLRRYLFAVMPIVIMYTTIGLAKIFTMGKNYLRQRVFRLVVVAVAIFLVAGNLKILLPYATFAENRGLFNQTEELSANFAPNDLVLIDRLAAGDGWTMIGGPMSSLLDKRAVYFFNAQDLEKIDISKFTKIYLIVPQQSESYYLQNLGDKIKPVKTYSFKTSRLDLSEKSAAALPSIKEFLITGTIYEYQ